MDSDVINDGVISDGIINGDVNNDDDTIGREKSLMETDSFKRGIPASMNIFA